MSAIAEVETAKSLVELPSPYAGTVEELHGDPGTTIPVGKPLITIAEASPSTPPREQVGSGGAGARPDEAGEAYRH